MLHFFNMLPKFTNENLCNLYSKNCEQMFAFYAKICYNIIGSNYVVVITIVWHQRIMERK